MPSVLFVCTANLCRSPMAAALFRRQVELAGADEAWRIESAGTWTRDGLPAPAKVRRVIEGWGMDLSDHRSRQLSGAMLADFPLTLVMTGGHLEALRVEFPAVAGRIHRLSEVAGHAYDIPDPITGTEADVRIVAKDIELLLEQGNAWIQERAAAGARG